MADEKESAPDRLSEEYGRWRETHQVNENDAPADPDVALSRDTGGVPGSRGDQATGDGHSTTGVGNTDEFVGRVAGDDPGYAGETGAEARSTNAAADTEREAPDTADGSDRP